MRVPPVLAVALLLAACSGGYPSSGRPHGPTFGGPVAAAERCVVVEEAEVDRAIRCGELEERDRELFARAWTAWTFGGPCHPTPEQEALLAAGTIRYDPAAIGRAAAELAATPCDDGEAAQALVARIRRGFEGTLEPGTPCTDTLACAQGHCPAHACGRVCSPLPGVGEPCAEEETPCAGELTCLDGLCRERPGFGEVCGDRCADGLWCGWEEDVRRCGVPVAAGEACDPLHLCPADHACAMDGAHAGTCVPEPGAGEPCPESRCAGWLACLDGTCVEPPHPGDSCEPDGRLACFLVPFAGCDPDTRRCVVRPSYGDPCVAGDAVRECTASPVAACADGVCPQPPIGTEAIGDRCSIDRDCGDDLICDADACADGCR